MYVLVTHPKARLRLLFVSLIVQGRSVRCSYAGNSYARVAKFFVLFRRDCAERTTNKYTRVQMTEESVSYCEIKLKFRLK